MDMRHCDAQELSHLQYVLMPGDKATFVDYAEQRGIDFAKYPMEVELSEIELSGMILTQENFESTVRGLFNGCVFDAFSGPCAAVISPVQKRRVIVTGRSVAPFDPGEVRAEKERIFKPMETTTASTIRGSKSRFGK